MSERKDTTGARSVRLKPDHPPGAGVDILARLQHQIQQTLVGGGTVPQLKAKGYIRGGGTGFSWFASPNLLMRSMNG